MFAYISSFVYTDNVTKMTNRLKNDMDHINVDEFNKTLKNTDSIIAGSYPLQVYHDEIWEGSDIDIFTANTAMKEYMDKNFKRDITLKSNNYDKLIKSSNNKNYDKLIKSSNNKNYDKLIKSSNNNKNNDNSKYIISELIEYNTSTIKIQLIIIKNIKNIKNILRNFDFDFCKTTFDGKEFNITDEGKNKVGNYSLKEAPCVLRYFRLIKYESRGFTILNRDKFNHNEIVKLYKENF
jgi:hypothetical protein